MRVLLVEDDEILGEAVRDHMALASHAIDWMRTLEDARAALELSQALLPLVKKVLMDFPEPARLLLLHDMGRTLRTEGEAVPAAERIPEFLVTEDAF